MYLECTPSYGRDYKSQKEIKSDYEAGKDFTIAFTGQQINKEDAEKDPNVRALNIRFKKLTQVCVINVKHL